MLRRIGMILDAPFPPDARVESEAKVLMDDGYEVHLLHIDFSQHQKYRSDEAAMGYMAGQQAVGASRKSGREPEADATTEKRIAFVREMEIDSFKGIHVWRLRGGMVAYKLSALAADLPFYRWWAAPLIRRFLKASRVDAIHVHDMAIAEAALAANRRARLPLVLDLHEDRPEIMKLYRHVNRWPGRLLISTGRWRRKQQELMRRADHVILVTEQARRVAERRDGIPSEKTTALPNVVWSDYGGELSFSNRTGGGEPAPEALSLQDRNEGVHSDTDPGSPLLQADSEFRLLYVGDTSLRRGTLMALEAVKRLRGQIFGLHLVLVGSSSQDDQLRAFVNKHGLGQIVRFEGWQPSERLPDYIRAADLCLSPLLRNSHHDTTYPNKLFQYMAMGRPVVVSDCPAQAAVVEEEMCGRVHTAGEPEALATAILELWKRPEERRRMGGRGAAAVENRWNWTVTAPRLTGLYGKLGL
ncbi:MAG: glycosyltransferase family 4 protein [Balneolaceae bacterium]